MNGLWFVVAAVVVVIVFCLAVVIACCKVSGDCAREEERDGKN